MTIAICSLVSVSSNYRILVGYLDTSYDMICRYAIAEAALCLCLWVLMMSLHWPIKDGYGMGDEEDIADGRRW